MAFSLFHKKDTSAELYWTSGYGWSCFFVNKKIATWDSTKEAISYFISEFSKRNNMGKPNWTRKDVLNWMRQQSAELEFV